MATTVVPPPAATLVADSRALDYLDVKSVQVDKRLTALQAWDLASGKPSFFLRAAFRIRDAVAGPLGLGRLGGFTGRRSSTPSTGDRLDFFTVEHIDDAKLALAVRDRHFHVVACIAVDDLIVTVTTSVAVKSWLGRLYMIPVGIGHHWIVADMLKKLRQGAIRAQSAV